MSTTYPLFLFQTRIVSGRRFVRWEVVPPLLHQYSKFISGLPLEFFFNKTSHATDVNQLHAHPLNINILSWKKGTIEDILDRVKDGRIRILDRPQGQSLPPSFPQHSQPSSHHHHRRHRRHHHHHSLSLSNQL